MSQSVHVEVVLHNVQLSIKTRQSVHIVLLATAAGSTMYIGLHEVQVFSSEQVVHYGWILLQA